MTLLTHECPILLRTSLLSPMYFLRNSAEAVWSADGASPLNISRLLFLPKGLRLSVAEADRFLRDLPARIWLNCGREASRRLLVLSFIGRKKKESGKLERS